MVYKVKLFVLLQPYQENLMNGSIWLVVGFAVGATVALWWSGVAYINARRAEKKSIWNFLPSCFFLIMGLCWLLAAMGRAYSMGNGYPAPINALVREEIYQVVPPVTEGRRIVALRDRHGDIRFYEMDRDPPPIFQVKVVEGERRLCMFP